VLDASPTRPKNLKKIKEPDNYLLPGRNIIVKSQSFSPPIGMFLIIRLLLMPYMQNFLCISRPYGTFGGRKSPFLPILCP